MFSTYDAFLADELLKAGPIQQKYTGSSPPLKWFPLTMMSHPLHPSTLFITLDEGSYLLGQIILCCEAYPAHCKMFSSNPVLDSQDVNRIPVSSSPLQVLTNKNFYRYCQMTPRAGVGQEGRRRGTKLPPVENHCSRCFWY